MRELQKQLKKQFKKVSFHTYEIQLQFPTAKNELPKELNNYVVISELLQSKPKRFDDSKNKTTNTCCKTVYCFLSIYKYSLRLEKDDL